MRKSIDCFVGTIFVYGTKSGNVNIIIKKTRLVICFQLHSKRFASFIAANEVFRILICHIVNTIVLYKLFVNFLYQL